MARKKKTALLGRLVCELCHEAEASGLTCLDTLDQSNPGEQWWAITCLSCAEDVAPKPKPKPPLFAGKGPRHRRG